MQPRDYLNQGDAHFSNGNFSLAIDMYNYVMSLHKDNAVSEYYQEAVSKRQTASTYDDLLKGQLDLADMYFVLHKFDKHIETIKKIIDLYPKHNKVKLWYNSCGIAYFSQKKYPAAIESFMTTLIIDPNYANTYYNLGVVYKTTGEFKLALANFIKAMELDSTLIKEVKDFKNYIFSHIQTLPLDERSELLRMYTDPSTTLGKLAIESRGIKKCKKGSGTLGVAHRLLEAEEDLDSTAKHLRLGFIKIPRKSVLKSDESELKIIRQP